ncbi:MAG: hypothetical protein E6G94_04030 [Alphaproteobacteria bacterium]|nr:MAG: hypothetical protein E6G94_04030 [Alphaproteobacteria bacterium]
MHIAIVSIGTVLMVGIPTVVGIWYSRTHHEKRRRKVSKSSRSSDTAITLFSGTAREPRRGHRSRRSSRRPHAQVNLFSQTERPPEE